MFPYLGNVAKVLKYNTSTFSSFSLPWFSFNPLVPNVPFLYPLKAPENRKVFWCFQGVEKGHIGNKWVNLVQRTTPHGKVFDKFFTLNSCLHKSFRKRTTTFVQGILENFNKCLNALQVWNFLHNQMFLSPQVKW